MVKLSVEAANDGVTNMDRDRVLLSEAEQGAVGARFYSWDGPWVTLGKFQRIEDTLLSAEVSSVIRPTGGAAVLHGHDLTFGLALPLGRIGATSRQVRVAYRAAVRPLVEAFCQIGIECALGEDLGKNDRRTSPYCFGLHSANDIVTLDSRQKVCGCAMHISEHAVLLQASIPKSPPLVDPKQVIKGASDAHWIEFDSWHLIDAWAKLADAAYRIK